jgi:DNA excision repair protein ERCC-3
VEHVAAALTAEDIVFEYVYDRSKPEPGTPWKLAVALRDYQETAVAAALEHERGVFHMATGTGKTEMMMAITAALGLRTLVLVNSRDLAVQTAKRFKERLPGVRIGVFGAGSRQLGDVTIAMLQSLRSWLRTDEQEARYVLRSFDVVHDDECHSLPAKTYMPVVMSVPAYYRFGWSATPFKQGDDRARLQLIGATGPVIMELSPQEAVQRGVSVPAFVTMLQWNVATPLASWPEVMFDVADGHFPHYAALYRSAIVRNDARNAAIVAAAEALARDGRPTLVLVNMIEHGARLAQALGAPFVHGSSEVATRKDVLQRLRDGGEHIIIASVIFDQGVDVPELAGLVIAGGGRAQHVVVQRIGRGSRTAEGKDRLEVIDLWDTHSRTMFRQARERARAYKSVGAAVEVVKL